MIDSEQVETWLDSLEEAAVGRIVNSKAVLNRAQEIQLERLLTEQVIQKGERHCSRCAKVTGHLGEVLWSDIETTAQYYSLTCVECRTILYFDLVGQRDFAIAVLVGNTPLDFSKEAE